MVNSLSLAILHRNQSQEITALIGKVPAWISEILIIDDDSTESELSALSKLEKSRPQVRVVCHALQNDFSAQRNFALSQARGSWTLFLDADERPAGAFFDKLQRLLEKEVIEESGEGATAFSIIRHQVFLGRELHHGDGGAQRLIRLAKTKAGQGRWRRAVHEVWDFPASQVKQTNLTITHHNSANITEFIAKLNRYASLEPAVRPRQSISTLLIQLLIYPKLKLFYNYLWKRGIIDGFPGLAHALCMSYYSAIVRIYLYEKHHTN